MKGIIQNPQPTELTSLTNNLIQIRRWVDNIKIDLREIGWAGSIWLRIGTSGGLF
jgi:hypothetical protein